MALTQASKELIKNIDPSQLNQAGALNGQVLKYSTTANKWEPGTVTGGGGGGSGNDVTINGASLAKAWVNFDGSGANGPATIRSSFNISSVNKVSSGLYTITFATPFTDTNYLINGTAGGGSVSYNNTVSIYHSPTPSTTSCTIGVDRADGVNLEDAPIVNVVFYANGGDISGNVVDNTPVGVINWFGATTPPTGYLECNGAAVLRTSYPDLDAAIYCGNATNGIAGFGYRCTSNTNPTGTRNATGQYIVLPDLRSEFIRGWDNGRGVDSGRTFGSWQKGTIMGYDQENDAVWHVSTTANAAGSITQATVGVDDYNVADYTGVRLKAANESSGSDLKGETLDSGGYTGITRPRNVALLPCIKAQKTFSSTFNLLDYIEKPATPTNGQVLTYDGPTSKWVARTGGGLVSGTAVTLAGIANADFTGIPNWVKRITIMLRNVSCTASSPDYYPVLQVGTSSGFVTTGYDGTTGGVQLNDSGAYDLSLTGFHTRIADTGVSHGSGVLTKLNDTIWCYNGMFGRSSSASIEIMAGSVVITGVLDRIRFTTTSTGTFDNGIINIMWE